MNETQDFDEGKKRNIFERWELKAIFLAVLFLVLGLFIVWIINNFIGFVGDAVYVSLLVIPIFAYLAFSGIIGELKGPGGWEVKFNKAALQKVEYQEAIDVEELELVVKGTVEQIKNRMFQLKNELPPSKPIVLTFQMGMNYYRYQESLQYVKSLSQFRNFKLVIFLDKMGRYEASISPRAILDLLNDPESATEFIETINEGDLYDLFNYPGIVRDSISTQYLNIDALRAMERLNVDELVVVDEKRYLKGIVERNKIISKLILETMTSS